MFLTESKGDEHDDNSTILCKIEGINQYEKVYGMLSPDYQQS